MALPISKHHPKATDRKGNLNNQDTFQPNQQDHPDSETDAPELSFGMPALLTRDDFVLLGTATDATSRVERVEVQLDGVGLWLPVLGPFQSDEAGTQSWLYSLDLPQEDHVEHQLRARAVDVAGNETVAEWQLTTVDNVAPDMTVETTLAEILLSDYHADNPTRDPKPIVSGIVSDGGGLSTVFARIKMPNGVEITSQAVLEGTAFSITPTFENLVSGEYRYTIETTDNAGNLTIHGPFVKTNQAVSIVLSNEKANYILKGEASERRRFIVARANYNRITYACGVSDTGFLNVTGQIRLVFTPCGGPAPNMGEPSMEKIHIPDSPKGNHWRYK